MKLGHACHMELVFNEGDRVSHAVCTNYEKYEHSLFFLLNSQSTHIAQEIEE